MILNSFPRISFLILFLSIILTVNCNETSKELPIAKKGILDLRKNIIGIHDKIPLNGEWEFSWQKFNQPNEERSFNNSEQIVNLPSSWKTYSNQEGLLFPREGFGTYRLKILLPANALKEQLSIRVPEIASAYKMYINNNLVAEQGRISKDIIKTIPWIKPRVVNTMPQDELDIIFNISNNDYNDGGFWNPIELGLTENIQREQFLSTSKEVFLFGAILIMGLYHIGFYFFRRSEKSILYFSIFCFLIAIRTIVTGNRILLDFFPGMPWDFFYRLEYLTFYSAPAPFFLFVSSLYKPLINKWINNFFVISFIAFIPLVFLPISFFTQSVRYFQSITLCGVLYVLIIIILATKRDYQGAKMFLIGWLFLAGTVIFDIMIDVFNVRTVYIASYGFIAFIFFQSLILSSRFSKAFKASEEFSLELSEYKTNLEKIIEERIKDISFLNRMTKEINSSSNIDSILKNVFQYAKSEFGIESVWMLSVEKSDNLLRTSKWVGLEFLTPEQNKVFSDLTIPLSQESGSLFRTYERKKIFYLPRLNRESTHGLDRIIIELLDLKSLLQIPLVLQGEVVAILCATSYSDALRLTKQELSVLASIAEQIAGAVHNSLLLQKSISAKKEADIATREAEKLAEISKELSSDTNLEKVFGKVADYLKSEFNLNYHWLLLVDKTTNELYTSIFNDLGLTKKSIRDKYKNIRIPLIQESGSLFATYARKKSFFLTKIPTKGLNGYDRIIIDDLELKSLLQVPIIIKGEVEGILSMTNFGERVILSYPELQRVFRFASQIAGAIYSTDLLRIAESERKKSNELLMNILPKDVAEELKNTGQVNPVQFESATILFTDFKGFTKIAETMTPNELINQLDGAFLQFDGISERFNLEKLKTIGDAYMCAGGLPVPNNSHPYDVCLAALEIKSFMDQVKFMRAKLGLSTWELRIGIHTGSVIAGVIGKKKFAYDIWGDTVNIASRMESAGAVGKINISEATYKLVEKLFVCESRGSVSIKNKGEMGMYYLESIKPEYSVKGQGKIPNKDFYLATL
jgi:class 3 adenylate cyclase